MVRLANSLYLAPLPQEYTSLPLLAQRFRTRWIARAEMDKRGLACTWATIVPYAAQRSAQAEKGDSIE